ncbi:tumor necrosis factor receptor superfamily member EDAR-like [Pecten maximus]|uniref:tumor necrosis factor receptor superfamily member EDAR-like n=1 Tax=Pecten maximus TaxID=6579 RepID=UPI00145890C7|nr:tumor necrosis factor receptor superfamily member EDAR-like [Pecten maximus]XP_033743332.1 tumor necrosis factor receptor superfamily member EDAR-like [Pecten maximus]XP_033743333.1 tumor necrosis factor receptor superfamily member EDAR-like [Pecten maximus]
MAVWMSSKCPQCLVLMLVLPVVCGGEAPYCTPGKQMYQDGRCVDCPECVPGQALNKTKEIETNMFGSMECYPCEECPTGTYSNDRRKGSFDGYKCYIHKDCGRRGRVVEIPGTSRTNNVCGKCLEGYISEDWPILDENSYCYPCSAKDKKKSDCRNFVPTTTPSTTTVTSRFETKMTLENQEPYTDVSSIIIPLVLAAVVVVLVVIIMTASIYRCRTNRKTPKENLDSEKGLLTDVVIDSPSQFSSASTGMSSLRTTTTDASEDPADEFVEDSEDKKCPTDEIKEISDYRNVRLTDDEMCNAKAIRLQNDDCYVHGVGNADMSPDEKKIKNLARSLGLPETQIDELIENKDSHLIAFLNKFIQRKGKEATLFVLYNVLVKHAAEPELKALVEILRNNASNL